ncbi:MAG: phosphoribosyl-AMP cyclohydrolase [Sphingomonadaceae bacterium]
MSSPADPADREQGTAFLPRYDANGLIAAMAIDATTSAPLMLAWMNAQALALTQSTGFAHFWSRSRQSLWKKGETSGHVLEVVDILVDCDQDALVLRCRPAGPACHTGARSCFYRKLDDGALVRADT